MEERAKILLVDDQPESLLAMGAVLEGPGIELVKAGSGVEALKHLLKDEFAVILLDVKMPDMDGFEAAALIRGREKTRHTPIIFVTAFRSEEMLFRGYYTGAVDYLFRPVVPEVLRSKIAIFVELHKKNQQLKRNAEILEKKNHELGALYDRLTEIDETKTRFFADVSHELRTPLTLLCGPLQRLLAEDGLSERHRREIEVVYRNSGLLLNRVEDLLTIAKLDAARVAVRYTACDLSQLVRLAASHFEALAGERQIQFTVATPPTVPSEVDPDKIEQVLMNLLSNAFKFASHGGWVHCELRAQDGDATLSVEDDGPGVPPSLRQAIFERFRQGTRAGAEHPAGTGLGLAIAKEFISLHRGSIKVEEGRSGGALFTASVPLSAPAGEVIESSDARMGSPTALTAAHVAVAAPWAHHNSAPPDWNPVGRKHAPLVLVVEDNPEMLHFVAGTLAGDYRVETARNGVEGLEKALKLLPDLILSDMVMPQKDGEELVREVRTHRQLDSVPIMLLTARTEEPQRTRLLREGAQEFLAKPFSVGELMARVNNLVSVKRAREALQRELTTKTHNLEDLVKELAEQRRAELAARAQAEEANQAKDHFLATVSHELRSPLAAMFGWCGLLRSGTLDAQTTARGLEIVERNVRLQAQLVDEILDVSRIITGKLRLDLKPLALGPLVEAAVDAVRPAAVGGSLELRVELGPAPGLVKGDADRLQQVIGNLLSNAVKFTPKGGTVTVRAARNESFVEISVSDTGTGISPDFLPYVFDSFRQADESSTRAKGGLGLGLAIVRHMVMLHDGTVRAESPGEGQGSTFTVALPLLSQNVEESISDDVIVGLTVEPVNS